MAIGTCNQAFLAKTCSAKLRVKVALFSAYLNSLSLFGWVCERARWGSLAWARFRTSPCSRFSLCICLSLHRSSSSSAFFLCCSTFLFR